MPPFDRLDYLYTPSGDVAAEAGYFTDVLGGRLVFAIQAMGMWVAMIELASGGRRIVLPTTSMVTGPSCLPRQEPRRRCLAARGEG